MFNKNAIDIFGQNNINMKIDAPNDSFDQRLVNIINYIDWKLIESWVLIRNNSKFEILDVGAGKGRMTRRFVDISKYCVALEPYPPFFKELDLSINASNLEKHNLTLNEYAGKHNHVFDLIYVSGVTPYMNDLEVEELALCANQLLKENGILLIRELGSEGDTFVGENEINRSSRHCVSLIEKGGFKKNKSRRAYPVILINKLYDMWPNIITKYVWNLASSKMLYSFWNFIAILNLPRPGRRCFYYYLFLKSYPENRLASNSSR